MAQHDYTIANADGATVRADMNSLFQAIADQNAGATAPPVTFGNMWWFDEATKDLKQRNEANTAWVLIGRKNASGWTPYREGALLGTAATKATGAAAGQVPTNDQAFADVASAATTNIGVAASENVRITGTTTITAFDTVAAGLRRRVRFAAALTLTHNAASLILPGAANITTAADDTAELISLGAGNWLCLWYKRASGEAVVGGAVAALAKFWVQYVGASAAIEDSFNVLSLTDNGPGDTTVTIDTDFASVAYAVSATCESARVAAVQVGTQAAGSLDITTTQIDGSQTDANHVHVIGFGDQA